MRLYNGSAWVDAYVSGANVIFTNTSAIKTAGNLTFNDSVKSLYGTGGDLEIYHDGSNSYVSDVGTGNLILQQGGYSISLPNETGTLASQTYAVTQSDNAAVAMAIALG